VLSGEVKTEAWVDVQSVARNVINAIGYTKASYKFDGNSCGVISAIHEQSPDINRGVVRQSEDEQGAGDQGMMFGYAVKDTENYMPVALDIAHKLLLELAAIRREGKQMQYLAPDAKSQVTMQYSDDHRPMRVDAIVVSTQHDDFVEASDNLNQEEADKQMLDIIYNDIKDILIPRVIKDLPKSIQAYFKNDFRLFVNPTGKFVVGGPHGDTGLTGRKIIVDTYGGKGAHGGGAFSGKDSSKVDRSAAYAMRHMAKNAVAAGLADEILVQVAYAIGVAEPVGIFVDTYGTAKVKLSDREIAEKLAKIFDLRPAAIIRRLKLKNPIYLPTASYGHFGREAYMDKVLIKTNGHWEEKEIEFFTWEKLDYVALVKAEFGL
jgi:S-adenosylmethionine synthetase